MMGLVEQLLSLELGIDGGLMLARYRSCSLRHDNGRGMRDGDSGNVLLPSLCGGSALPETSTASWSGAC